MGTIRKLNNNVNIVGSNIKKFRELRELSQPDICKKMQLMGVTMYIADIYEIENNKRLVKDFEIKAFCKALDVTFEELFDNTDQYFEH